MLRCFAGQRTKTPIVRKTFTGIVVIVEETAACYLQTLEALLFNPLLNPPHLGEDFPPSATIAKGGAGNIFNLCDH